MCDDAGEASWWRSLNMTLRRIAPHNSARPSASRSPALGEGLHAIAEPDIDLVGIAHAHDEA